MRAVALSTLIVVAACAPPPAPVAVAARVEPAAGPAEPPQHPAPLPWPEAGSCRELLAAVAAMPEAERARLEPAAAPIAFAVRDGGFLLPPTAAEAEVTADLPLPAGTGDVRCLLVVDRAHLKNRRPTDVAAALNPSCALRPPRVR